MEFTLLEADDDIPHQLNSYKQEIQISSPFLDGYSWCITLFFKLTSYFISLLTVHDATL